MKNPKLLVLIKTDEKVAHGCLVIAIMDATRQARLAKMIIAVEAKEAR
jgi:hypothetical protein